MVISVMSNTGNLEDFRMDLENLDDPKVIAELIQKMKEARDTLRRRDAADEVRRAEDEEFPCEPINPETDE